MLQKLRKNLQLEPIVQKSLEDLSILICDNTLSDFTEYVF